MSSPRAHRAAMLFGSLAMLCAAAPAAYSRGAAEDVAAGNAAYSRGDLAQAAALYDRARRGAPGSPVPLLDFGIALYAKGDYAGALTAFQGVQTQDEAMASELHYDQGNALARLGKSAEKDDPKAALDLYERSVAAYKRALQVDPRLSAAAVNVEVVREWIKSLKDAQSQGSEASQQQEPGSGQAQNTPGQSAPGQGSQPPSGQSANPGQGQQAPQVPGNPPAASGQNAAPPNETAEAILQEERDRRQAEARAGGTTTNGSPNW